MRSASHEQNKNFRGSVAAESEARGWDSIAPLVTPATVDPRPFCSGVHAVRDSVDDALSSRGSRGREGNGGYGDGVVSDVACFGAVSEALEP